MKCITLEKWNYADHKLTNTNFLDTFVCNIVCGETHPFESAGCGCRYFIYKHFIFPILLLSFYFSFCLCNRIGRSPVHIVMTLGTVLEKRLSRIYIISSILVHQNWLARSTPPLSSLWPLLLPPQMKAKGKKKKKIAFQMVLWLCWMKFMNLVFWLNPISLPQMLNMFLSIIGFCFEDSTNCSVSDLDTEIVSLRILQSFLLCF